jgi:hypothetical protein
MSNNNGTLTCDIGAGCYSLSCLQKNPTQQERCQKSDAYCAGFYPGSYLNNCACALDEEDVLRCDCETSKNKWEKVPVPDNCAGKFMYYQGGKLQCDETGTSPKMTVPAKPVV